MFLLHSFLLGVILTFFYDGFLILRRLFKHTMFLISLEDLIFWVVCALSVFYALYEENNGTLRWFAIAGAALGMIAYKKTISPLIVFAVTKLLSFVFGIVGRIAKMIGKPFRFAGEKMLKSGRFVEKKAGNLRKILRKKLTGFIKTLKIILYKQ